jgi:putative hydrolase of the HAD superfamily
MNTKIVWFDFGGVLSPPISDLFISYFLKTGIQPKDLQLAMKHVADDMHMDILSPIEKGILTEQEWGYRLREKLRINIPKIDLSRAHLEEFGCQWFQNIQPNKIMIDTFCRVKCAGIKVGILTNNVSEWEPYWKEVIGIEDLADHIVDSCKIHCRKPERSIFKFAEEKAKCQPEECLLIDDVEENCNAAISIGWKSIHFENNTNTVIKLFEQLSHEGMTL